jgi:hypothetical protein
VWLATVYSLTVSCAITHLYTGGGSSSQGSILVASNKQSDKIKDIRKDIRTIAATRNIICLKISCYTVVLIGVPFDCKCSITTQRYDTSSCNPASYSSL